MYGYNYAWDKYLEVLRILVWARVGRQAREGEEGEEWEVARWRKAKVRGVEAWEER